MEHLQEELESLLRKVSDEKEIRERIESLVSVYPFNDYEYLICTLIAMNALTLDDYYEPPQ